MRHFIASILVLACTLGIAPVYAESLGEMVESFGQSIGQGLENFGNTLNRANDSFLNTVDGNNPASPAAQLREYRKLEAARVTEMSEITGVGPEYIRKLRSDGATWREIAQKYGYNLDNLPQPLSGAGN